MSTVYGMDIQAGRDLATQMDNDGTTIEELTARLTSLLEQTPWFGPDADRFKSDWNGQYVPSLRQVVDALRANAEQMRRQAQAQEDASS